MTGHTRRELNEIDELTHRGSIPCPVCGAPPGEYHRPSSSVNRPTSTPEPNRPTEEL